MIVDEGIGWTELKKYIDLLSADEVDELHLKSPNFSLSCELISESMQDFLARNNHIITTDFGKYTDETGFYDEILRIALQKMMALGERRLVPKRDQDGKVMLQPEDDETFRRRAADEGQGGGTSASYIAR